jgi:hypothetical protein
MALCTAHHCTEAVHYWRVHQRRGARLHPNHIHFLLWLAVQVPVRKPLPQLRVGVCERCGCGAQRVQLRVHLRLGLLCLPEHGVQVGLGPYPGRPRSGCAPSGTLACEEQRDRSLGAPSSPSSPRYDVGADEWTTVTNMPPAYGRRAYTPITATSDGTLYQAGGDMFMGGYSQPGDLWVSNDGGSTWAAKPPRAPRGSGTTSLRAGPMPCSCPTMVLWSW